MSHYRLHLLPINQRLWLPSKISESIYPLVKISISAHRSPSSPLSPPTAHSTHRSISSIVWSIWCFIAESESSAIIGGSLYIEVMRIAIVSKVVSGVWNRDEDLEENRSLFWSKGNTFGGRYFDFHWDMVDVKNEIEEAEKQCKKIEKGSKEKP